MIWSVATQLLYSYHPSAINLEETAGLSSELTELATAVKTVPDMSSDGWICWIKTEVEWFYYWLV